VLAAQQGLGMSPDVDEIDVDEARNAPGAAELAAHGVRPHDKVIARFVLGITFRPRR
jgi:hypothetical protein